MGSWLKVNGEAIYASQPWKYQNDTKTSRIWQVPLNLFLYAIIEYTLILLLKLYRYTSKKSESGTVVYAAVHDWPSQNVLTLGAPKATKDTKVTMLGYPGTFIWTSHGNEQGLEVLFPFIPPNKLPSVWAWVLKITNVE